MDESQVALEADLQNFDEVLLSDRAFDIDPSKILREAADPQKLRYCLIEWLAEAPNRKVKAERKKNIAETLDVSTRQVERLLDRHNDEQLHETAGIDRKVVLHSVKKGHLKIDEAVLNNIVNRYGKKYIALESRNIPPASDSSKQILLEGESS